MLYSILKFIHILSTAILLGSWISTAGLMVYGHRTRNVPIIAAITRYVVLASWALITSALLIELITTLLLVFPGCNPEVGAFAWGSIFAYTVLWLCWLGMMYLQIKMRNFAVHATQFNTKLPRRYERAFRYWTYLCLPVFISLMYVFNIMTRA